MRVKMIALATVAAVIATPAAARDGQAYIGIEGGIVFEDQVEIEAEPFQGTPPLNQAFVNTGEGWEGDVILGYDFGAFRLEGELGYKNQDYDTFGVISPNNTLGLPAGFRTGPSSTQKTYSGMVNALLDIGNEDGLQFYVGGGAGLAKVKFDLTVPGQGTYIDDSDTSFAYQGIAGVRYPVTDNIDLGVKYRYFRIDNLNIEGFGNNALETAHESHSVLASVIVNFGGRAEPAPEPYTPPPAVTPPAPPPPAPPAPAPTVACNKGPYIVFFEWDRSDITPEAATVLDNAASAYRNCGTASVMLAGHTDTSGTMTYNEGLANRRNMSVRSYLSGRGIPDGRITAQGFGETQLRVPTADGVRELQNRRVEVTYGPGSGM